MYNTDKSDKELLESYVSHLTMAKAAVDSNNMRIVKTLVEITAIERTEILKRMKGSGEL